MTPIVVGLATAAIGLLLAMLVLERRSPRLRATEQAYSLHELRDRLQLLAIQRELDVSSVSYLFMMSSLNLAIRNAGVMSLSQVLQISRAVKRNADDITFEQIFNDVKQRGEGIQKLYEDFFQALTSMLITNDHLTSIMFMLARDGATAFNRVIIRTATSVGKVLLPERTEAVYEARQFQRWTRRVHALSY